MTLPSGLTIPEAVTCEINNMLDGLVIVQEDTINERDIWAAESRSCYGVGGRKDEAVFNVALKSTHPAIMGFLCLDVFPSSVTVNYRVVKLHDDGLVSRNQHRKDIKQVVSSYFKVSTI